MNIWENTYKNTKFLGFSNIIIVRWVVADFKIGMDPPNIWFIKCNGKLIE